MGLENRITLNEAVQFGLPYYLLELSQFGDRSFPISKDALSSFDVKRSLFGLAVGPDSDIGIVNITNRKFYESILVPAGPLTFFFGFVTPVQVFDVETRAPFIGSVEGSILVGGTVSEKDTDAVLGPTEAPPGAVTLGAVLRYKETYFKLDGSVAPFSTDNAFISPSFQMMLYLQPNFEGLRKRPAKRFHKSMAGSAAPEVPIAMICVNGRKKATFRFALNDGSANFRVTAAKNTNNGFDTSEYQELLAATVVTPTTPFGFDVNDLDADWVIIYGEVTAGVGITMDTDTNLFD